MKSYEEIAKNVFEKRDAHRARQRQIRSAIGVSMASAGVLCVVMFVSLGVYRALQRPLEETLGFGGGTHSVGEHTDQSHFGEAGSVNGSENFQEQAPEDGRGSALPDGLPEGGSTDSGEPSTGQSEPHEGLLPQTDSTELRQKLFENADLIIRGRILSVKEKSDTVREYSVEVLEIYSGTPEKLTDGCIRLYVERSYELPLDTRCVLFARLNGNHTAAMPGGYYIYGGKDGMFLQRANGRYLNAPAEEEMIMEIDPDTLRDQLAEYR